MDYETLIGYAVTGILFIPLLIVAISSSDIPEKLFELGNGYPRQKR